MGQTNAISDFWRVSHVTEKSIFSTPMPGTIENVGSTARDFCMLERNVLSHLKLGECTCQTIGQSIQLWLLLCSTSAVTLIFQCTSQSPPPRSTRGLIRECFQVWCTDGHLTNGCLVGSYRRCILWIHLSHENHTEYESFSCRHKVCPPSCSWCLVVWFLTTHRCSPHFAMIGVVAGVVFTTCIILLADENELWAIYEPKSIRQSPQCNNTAFCRIECATTRPLRAIVGSRTGNICVKFADDHWEWRDVLAWKWVGRNTGRWCWLGVGVIHIYLLHYPFGGIPQDPIHSRQFGVLNTIWL